MNQTTFSQAGTTKNHKTIKKKENILEYTIPYGWVGFLDEIKLSPIDISWDVTIDGENIPDQITNKKNNIFSPPFLCKKNIVIQATNPYSDTIDVETSIEGRLYQDKFPVLTPVDEKPEKENNEIKQLLSDIKTEIQTQTPSGSVTDKYITVTDKVKLVKNHRHKDLNWMSCSICNKGHKPVYAVVNKWRRPTASISPGECENINLKKRNAIKKLYLTCDKGETTIVRIHALK